MDALAVRINRPEHLATKVVFVDGIEGCGKTMLAPIIAALERVELLTYAFEIEHLCSLKHLNKIEDDAASATISLVADLQLYDSMQSRGVNFRPSDLSSVFRASQPLRYFRRLFQKGGQYAVERIAEDNPILLLTTHKLIAYGGPIFDALGKRVTLIEVVRHPLYMVIQNTLNFTGITGTVRGFTIHYDYQGKNVPFFASGWEDRYLSANPIERAIYYIQHMTDRSNAMREKIRDRFDGQILTVPFEKFVVTPDPYMRLFEGALSTKATTHTMRTMAKQKVPRNKYADSIDLAVYRRCGWEPPKAGLSEREEFEYRRMWAASQASPDAMQVLDNLCNEYETRYMEGALRKNGQSSQSYI